MIEYQFFLDAFEVDEPEGFDAIELSISRGEMHGIGFEASTSTLKFYDAGARYIQNLYDTQGLKAKVIFSAQTRCIGPYAEWDDLMSGRLNFGKLKMDCGNECSATIPVEVDSCELVLNSRYDQQVDIDSMPGVDGITALPQYNEMGGSIELPAVKLLVIDEAKNTTGGKEVISDQPTFVSTDTGNNMFGYIIPKLDTTINSSFGQFNPGAFTQLYTPGSPLPENETAGYTVDTTVLIGGLKCNFGDGEFSFRIKGSHTLTAGIATMGLTVKVIKMPARLVPDSTQPFFNWVTLYTQTLSLLSTPATPTASFDLSGSFTAPVVQGDRFDFIITAIAGRFSEITKYELTIAADSFFKMQAPSTCEPSDTQYYMIHEALSHVTEEITNGCLRVKSSYYGRINSQPYSFPADGCGGLRFLTSGLKIRNAPGAKFFASLKQIIEGLNPIDNIGFGVIGNDLVIEGVRYFYKDKEIARCPFISDVSSEVDENGHYAKITSGYANWKVQKINGLDEFNSEREFKTSFETISSELKIQSDLVTGSYPIEITRQQSFADTGAADTTYDNNIFLICVKHAPSPYTTFDVEQGGIDNPANIYSPETAYNWRIRPIANMLRWFKTIAAGYRNLSDAANKIFFSSGTGNFLATGLQIDTTCRPENFPTKENQDLFYNQTSDNQPIWRNENVTFEYPMSISEYQKIKSDPYGYVSYQCGNGEWAKGYIKDLRFRINKGTATYVLKRAY